MKYLSAIFILSLIFTNSSFASCENKFYMGKEPIIENEKLMKSSKFICYDDFALLHSGLSKTGLWSAEFLNKNSIDLSKNIDRVNNFHADPNLNTEERSELKDYEKSGYDRGHLTPADDETTEQSQYQSFSLANMIPQNPKLNRGSWKNLEIYTRKLAKVYDIYVVTGSIFVGENLVLLNNRVIVPSKIYKAIYIPEQKVSGVYVADNDNSENYELLNLAQFQKKYNIDVFPEILQEEKQQNTRLMPIK